MSFSDVRTGLAAITAAVFVWLMLAAPAAAASYKEVSVSNGGTISGKIALSGPAPAPDILRVTKDKEACGTSKVNNALVVSANGGIANAVVTLENIKKGKKWDLPSQVAYGQSKCLFSPRVVIIRPRAKVVVGNADTIKHNFHTISRGIFSINKMMSAGTELVVKKGKIRKSGIVKVKCDLHRWMGGAWYVAKSPYTVLTDAEGNFTLENVPAGKYKLTVWHEKLGSSSQKVKLAGGGTASVELKLSL